MKEQNGTLKNMPALFATCHCTKLDVLWRLQLFRDFIEDYNTGTLPHKKYYNLESYHKYKEAKAAAKGLKRPEKKKSAVDDEAALRAQRAGTGCVRVCVCCVLLDPGPRFLWLQVSRPV